MSEFKAEVVNLEIEPHPNADMLEVATIGAYKAVVAKGEYKTGDLAVYIPEQAIVPRDVLDTLGLVDRLAGRDKNRVKAIRLRGIVSQGIVHPLGVGRLANDYFRDAQEGYDATEALGIVKWVPPIPAIMAGEVYQAPDMTLKYDIENWKKYPDLISEGDEIVATEKIHGTFCGLGFHNYSLSAFSKGLGARCLAFKMEAEANKRNIYVKKLTDRVNSLMDIHNMWKQFLEDRPFFVLGEIFGRGVQDLDYGFFGHGFRVFDMYVGEPGKGFYLGWDALVSIMDSAGFETVPVVYRGPWKVDSKVQDGVSLIGGNGIREGVVIRRPVETIEELTGQRHILKVVSNDYLFRKGGTEHE